MSTGTSLVAFKQASVAGLAARPGLADVCVLYEFPYGSNPVRSMWFAGAESDNSIPVMRAGTKKVDEEYVVTLVVQVLKTQGEGQPACDLDAAALLAEVQQFYAENPQITPEIMWAQVGGWEQSIGPFGVADGGDANRGSRFEVRIVVRARLFPS